MSSVQDEIKSLQEQVVIVIVRSSFGKIFFQIEKYKLLVKRQRRKANKHQSLANLCNSMIDIFQLMISTEQDKLSTYLF